MKKSLYLLQLSLLLCLTVKAQTFQWAKKFDGTSSEEGYSIAVDDSGNVYTTGWFYGTVDFDPGPGMYNLTADYADVFISKLNTSGGFVWAIKIGGMSYEYGLSIDVDYSGNVYITGEFYNTAVFYTKLGPYYLTSAGINDVFICKLDSLGDFVWAKQIGGNLPDCGQSITVDDSGNVYSTGWFSDTVDFDPSIGVYNLISAGLLDIYISKLNASGDFIWAKQMGGIGDDKGHSIEVDNSGNIYVTGEFSGIADFDPSIGTYNLTAVIRDIFISKLNTSGNLLWAKQIAGTGYGWGESVTVDNLGNIYTTGAFQDTADFNPGIGTYNLSSVSRNIFISKLNSLGDFVWAKQIGGIGDDWGHSIVVDDSGNVYSTGAFQDTADFDPGIGAYNLISIDSTNDIFISKLNSLGDFVWAKQIGGNSSDIGNSIAVDSSGNIYTTGFFYGTVDFDPGSGIYNLTSGVSFELFIHKMSQNTGAGIYQERDSEIVFFIYPNPANDIVTIETKLKENNGILTINDVNGRELINHILKGNKSEVDISQLSRGLYFIKLANENEVAFGRFVKE